MKLLKTTAKRPKNTQYIRLEMLLHTQADLHDLHKPNLPVSELNMFQVQYPHRKKTS